LGSSGYEAGKLLRSLRDKAELWWYFLDHPEVPPDNNQAERSLRLAVTKRKVSGGSRTITRFAQTADLLSVLQTCRRQGRSVIEFFKQAGNSEVREWDIPAISVAPVNYLNSYHVEPENQGGSLKSALHGYSTQLAQMVDKYPDATLSEYCEYWGENYGSWVSTSTMCRALQKEQLTRKKNVP